MKKNEISIKLSGLSDILFDRFIDHSKEVRPPEQKLYMTEGNKVILPAENFRAFLFNEKVPGCTGVFEGRKRKDYNRVGITHTAINPVMIPFTDEKGKPIVFKDFKKGKFYIYESAPVTKASGGQIVKQERIFRPAIKTPWFLKFNITLLDNPLIDENKLYNWLSNGGVLIALGAYRPLFGRFEVVEWEVD